MFQARWAAQSVSPASLSANLGAVADRRWVVEQCLQRTADSEASQKAVLQSALEETSRHCGPSPPGSVAEASGAAAAEGGAGSEEAREEGGKEEGDKEEALWWQCARLRVLQHLERLDTLCAMFEG